MVGNQDSLPHMILSRMFYRIESLKYPSQQYDATASSIVADESGTVLQLVEDRPWHRP